MIGLTSCILWSLYTIIWFISSNEKSWRIHYWGYCISTPKIQIQLFHKAQETHVVLVTKDDQSPSRLLTEEPKVSSWGSYSMKTTILYDKPYYQHLGLYVIFNQINKITFHLNFLDLLLLEQYASSSILDRGLFFPTSSLTC